MECQERQVWRWRQKWIRERNHDVYRGNFDLEGFSSQICIDRLFNSTPNFCMSLTPGRSRRKRSSVYHPLLVPLVSRLPSDIQVLQVRIQTLRIMYLPHLLSRQIRHLHISSSPSRTLSESQPHQPRIPLLISSTEHPNENLKTMIW